MPRPFSEPEREHVQRRLVEVAREHFARYGYRRASVADIARECGIGKGSVYLFVASKAELFARVALEAEADVRARLLEEMKGPFSSPRERLRSFLRFQLGALVDHPVLSIVVNPEDAAALFRELPPERMAELRASDDAFFAALVEEWRGAGEIGPVDPAVVGALARALYAMSLQRELIGAEAYPAVVELVIDGLSRALAPEGA